MSSGELLLTLVVALIVFGPQKLPQLARHLGKLTHALHALKTKAATFWQAQLAQDLLNENTSKAKKADNHYQKIKKPKR